MKKKLMNKRYVKVCAYLKNVFYGKKSVCIANILSTSNQAAAITPTKASAPVVATRSHLARKHLAIIAIIAITGFVACPNNNNSNSQAYTCPNGDPKIGTTTNESTVNCIACDTGFSLEANACIASPWTLRDSGTTGSLHGVAYGGASGSELFVAVGDPVGAGNAAILTSPNGITWTLRDSEVRQQLFSVTYGGPSGSELFVAVGNAGEIITSPDGNTWTARTSGTTNSLSDVTYGNFTFVAVGTGGDIMTSPDGITWTARTSGTVNGLQGVTYGGASRRELFVAVGFCPKDSNNNCSGDGTIITSPDGITWTSQTSALQSNFNGIASRTDGLSTIFAAVGGCLNFLNINAMCSHSNPIATSSNGIGWSTKENPSERTLFGVTATADGFLAVGFCPLDSKGEKCIDNAPIVASSDGITWTAEDSGVRTFLLTDVAYGNGISVIVGLGNDCANVLLNRDCSGNSVILTK